NNNNNNNNKMIEMKRAFENHLLTHPPATPSNNYTRPTPINSNNFNSNNNSNSNNNINNNNNNNFINNNNNINNTNNNNNYNNNMLNNNNNLYKLEPSTMVDQFDEDIDEQLREYLAPMFAKYMDKSTKEHLAVLIAEYLSDELPLRTLVNDLRMITMDDRTLLHYLIEIFIVMDTTNKMYNYLLENGVDEPELNIDTKNFAMLFDAEMVFKKRERSRKSVSRGLRNPPNKWTKEESQRLIQLVHESGDKQWKKIAMQIGGGKTGAQCAQHWKRVLCPAIRKGSWDEEEEAKLFILVDKHGQSWKNVASEIRTRTDIQCRYQYFKSCMSREVPWSPKEDELLQKKVIECKQEGREISWMDLSKSMARARQTKIPRTALECKSRWEAISMGSIVDGMDLTSH
ncbi:hypothetical protein SAMD00019534_025930, partial [Acytostelium subglobosum LB1]|uniref:hypothetical protein n=1 Tax=Acytostelium subglobosum LB1 TaxID=1410327 RepID=UPI000644C8BA